MNNSMSCRDISEVNPQSCLNSSAFQKVLRISAEQIFHKQVHTAVVVLVSTRVKKIWWYQFRSWIVLKMAFAFWPSHHSHAHGERGGLLIHATENKIESAANIFRLYLTTIVSYFLVHWFYFEDKIFLSFSKLMLSSWENSTQSQILK